MVDALTAGADGWCGRVGPGYRRRVRTGLVLITILAVLHGGCGEEGCVSPDREFALDLDILESDVAAILADGAASRDAIECAEACEQVYFRDRGGQPYIKQQESCTLELDLDAGASPEAVVGHVMCAGVDNPNGCE